MPYILHMNKRMYKFTFVLFLVAIIATESIVRSEAAVSWQKSLPHNPLKIKAVWDQITGSLNMSDKDESSEVKPRTPGRLLSPKSAKARFEERESWCPVERMKEEDWCRKTREHYEKAMESHLFSDMGPSSEPRCTWEVEAPTHRERRHFPAKHRMTVFWSFRSYTNSLYPALVIDLLLSGKPWSDEAFVSLVYEWILYVLHTCISGCQKRMRFLSWYARLKIWFQSTFSFIWRWHHSTQKSHTRSAKALAAFISTLWAVTSFLLPFTCLFPLLFSTTVFLFSAIDLKMDHHHTTPHPPPIPPPLHTHTHTHPTHFLYHLYIRLVLVSYK